MWTFREIRIWLCQNVKPRQSKIDNKMHEINAGLSRFCRFCRFSNMFSSNLQFWPSTKSCYLQDLMVISVDPNDPSPIRPFKLGVVSDTFRVFTIVAWSPKLQISNVFKRRKHRSQPVECASKIWVHQSILDLSGDDFYCQDSKLSFFSGKALVKCTQRCSLACHHFGPVRLHQQFAWIYRDGTRRFFVRSFQRISMRLQPHQHLPARFRCPCASWCFVVFEPTILLLASCSSYYSFTHLNSWPHVYWTGIGKDGFTIGTLEFMSSLHQVTKRNQHVLIFVATNPFSRLAAPAGNGASPSGVTCHCNPPTDTARSPRCAVGLDARRCHRDQIVAGIHRWKRTRIHWPWRNTWSR